MIQLKFIKLMRCIILLFCASIISACATLQPLPEGISFAGQIHPVEKVNFLRDLTYKTPDGTRKTDQEIFDRWLQIIRGAKRHIVIDAFLFTDAQGPIPERQRPLAQELTDALLAQKKRYPNMRVIVIVDPINILYGGIRSPHFATLRQAGIEVHITDLTKLRDSNPSWSIFWRLFVRPFGNSTNGIFPTPFSEPEGTVSLRSYLSFLNLKANHRKVLIADKGHELVALVTSFNPADSSAAHSNIALEVSGPAAHDLLSTENAVLKFSGAQPLLLPKQTENKNGKQQTGLSVQVLTESKVRDDLFETIKGLKEGDRLDLVMYLLADRHVIAALKKAHKRGVKIRILLDPSLGVFGLSRGGLPNAPAAYELRKKGIDIRWCEPVGAQCHSKLMFVRKLNGQAWLSLGTANLTRKHLNDFNLETNLVIRGLAEEPVFTEVAELMEAFWANSGGKTFSKPLEEVKRHSVFTTIGYHLLERSGWASW